MAEVAYITRDLLKARLALRSIPLPVDPDLDRLIAVASGMVKDRTVVFEDTAPPMAVQQVTLMLAMNLRVSEVMQYADADGRPVQVKIWTPGMADILGDLELTDTPDEVIHAPQAGDLAVPAGHALAEALAERRGRRDPWERRW